MEIKGLNFQCTCDACPEQYDVFDSNGNIVGYVRLRYGGLRCNYPNSSGETIYYANIGDGWCGIFESEDQRRRHLTNIACKIRRKINEQEYYR